MSTGFHRMGANIPGKLPGFSNMRFVTDTSKFTEGFDKPTESVLIVGHGDRTGVIPAKDPAHPETELRPPIVPAMGRIMAQQSGYTGDQCSHCQSMRMKVSGHCLVCEDCGTTTGCS